MELEFHLLEWSGHGSSARWGSGREGRICIVRYGMIVAWGCSLSVVISLSQLDVVFNIS